VSHHAGIIAILVIQAEDTDIQSHTVSENIAASSDFIEESP
jgi:hypothetical protein